MWFDHNPRTKEHFVLGCFERFLSLLGSFEADDSVTAVSRAKDIDWRDFAMFLVLVKQSVPQTGIWKEKFSNLKDHDYRVPNSILFHEKRLQMMLSHHKTTVNSHQRWKQTRFRVCFHLWCELTSTIDVTEWQVSWNSWLHDCMKLLTAENTCIIPR